MSLYVDIQKNFGRFRLNMQFETQNETLALLGASGCGKSITLKCVAGIEKPDKGVIVLDGKTLFDSKKGVNLSPQKRNVGLMFQNYALFPNMTVEENIAAGLRRANNRRKSDGDIKDKISSLLSTFLIEELKKLYPSQLSGGQQQRVALARMIATGPQIIMLDEPFSALDSYLRWQLERELEKILADFKERHTVLYVSHNRDEVYRLCDSIAVIKDGLVDVLEEKWSLFHNPKTYSAALLTGCKNISAAEKVDDHTIYVPEWDLSLHHRMVPSGLKHIGFRAKTITFAENENDENAFEYEIVSKTEDAFYMILYIKKKGSNAKLPIRWEVLKDQYAAAENAKKVVQIRREDVFALI